MVLWKEASSSPRTSHSIVPASSPSSTVVKCVAPDGVCGTGSADGMAFVEVVLLEGKHEAEPGGGPVFVDTD
eukprot:8017374-Prorocentrum_lima.AAC.1